MLDLRLSTQLGSTSIAAELSVGPGECVAIAGPSGAGKTSILRAVAGLITPRVGRIVANDEVWLDTARDIEVPPERRRCGYVFQEYALFPHLSAWENVAYPLRGMRKGERRARALELLDRFGLTKLADAAPRTLSGGERQRVALARALARGPEVLLLDEPLSALDARTRVSASAQLAEVLAAGDAPALFVTHDFTEAAQIGDRVVIVDHGRIVQEGTATELAATPSTPFVADFTGAVVLTGTSTVDRQGLAHIKLDGVGSIVSTDQVEGRVAASVYPWEISIEPRDSRPHGSTQNRIPVEIDSITTVGGRARLGLSGPQPLVAEVTLNAVDQLGLRPGSGWVATWKATATRLVVD